MTTIKAAAASEVVVSVLHAPASENGVASSAGFSAAAEKKASAYYASQYLQESIAPVRQAQMQTRFSGAMVLLACAYVGLLLGLTQYTTFETQPQAQIDHYYQYLMHVNIMVSEGGCLAGHAGGRACRVRGIDGSRAITHPSGWMPDPTGHGISSWN